MNGWRGNRRGDQLSRFSRQLTYPKAFELYCGSPGNIRGGTNLMYYPIGAGGVATLCPAQSRFYNAYCLMETSQPLWIPAYERRSPGWQSSSCSPLNMRIVCKGPLYNTMLNAVIKCGDLGVQSCHQEPNHSSFLDLSPPDFNGGLQWWKNRTRHPLSPRSLAQWFNIIIQNYIRKDRL